MDDENVISFRPRDGAPPGLPPLPVATIDPPSAPPPEDGADLVPTRARSSAGDSLAAVPAGLPPLPATPPGTVPAAFRSEGAGDVDQAPRLGALSLSALLAVALAALRGTVTAVQDWRQRRLEKAAETAPWREARIKRRAAEEDARARLAKVPSSQEFGRKSLGSGPPSKSGSGGTSGSWGGSKKTGPTPSSSRSSGLGGGGRQQAPKDGKGSGGKNDPKGPKPKGPKTGPEKPSSGLLAPSKGKGSGGTGRGLLERVKDRKDGGKGRDRKDPTRSGGGGGRQTGTGTKDTGPSKGKGKGKKGRTRLEKVTDGAGRRLEQRRKHPDPPAVGKDRPKGPKDKPKGGGGRTVSGPKKPGAQHGTPDGYADGCRCRRCVKAATRQGRTAPGPHNGWKVPGIKHGTTEGYDVHECRCKRCTRAAKRRDRAKGSGPNPTAPGGSSRPGGTRKTRTKTKDRRFRPGGQPPPPPPGGGRAWAPPPRGERRSAWESMRDATDDGPVITVERADRPGDQARRWEPAAVTTGARGLPAAGPEPSTSTSTEETPMGAPARMPAPPGVADQHLTDVTLDDVLEHLAASKGRCFDTYDECAALADKARHLRDALAELADELAEHHNVVGRLTSAAMDRLSESMDLLARKAEEMRGESLHAAEAVEVAHDEMHDAYRPVQQAAADAGLDMPSARVHNEE